MIPDLKRCKIIGLEVFRAKLGRLSQHQPLRADVSQQSAEAAAC
jgi:hypothetical protein